MKSTPLTAAPAIGTVRAARDMQLDHKTWVLDDGRSDEPQQACLAEGVRYLRREGREHAKAGNVNAGLARTIGEFVVVLDADHVPSPDFLVRALPYKDRQGTIVKWVGTSTDIDEQKQAEARVKASEQNLRVLAAWTARSTIAAPADCTCP